jgi:hypothetical protein
MVQDPMMESMEGSLRHHQLTSQIININGTQHIITSSKPLPDLKRLHNHHVEVRRLSLIAVGGIMVLGLPDPDPFSQRYGSGSFPFLINVLSVLK